MTISSTSNRVQFSGNSVTVAFPFTFKTFDEGDLTVVLTDSTGEDATQAITTNYTVSLNADQNNNPGGTLTMLVAPATGEDLTIARQVDALQETDITNGGGFYPEVIENALDLQTMLAQQFLEQLGRAMVVPISSAAVGELPDAAGRASKYLAFDAQGNPAATSGTTNLFIVSTFAETLLDDTTAAMMQATLGLEIGTNVQAYNATLAALAAQTEAANKVQYYTADNTPGLLDFKDEDNMASNSATAVPSQQSVKAYADASRGTVVQVVEATPVVTVVTCATVIPNDDSIPQNTEGNEVITVTITPTSATNRLRIEAEAICCISATGYTTMALFQDSTAGSLAVDTYYESNQSPDKRMIVHEMAAGTTVATTFKMRVGPNTGTVYVNGQAAGTRIFGGVSAARIRVTEIKV